MGTKLTISEKILETERLILRKMTLDDAQFIFELVNEPAFINNIGDKGVHDLDDAREYITKGPLTSYERFGFGLFLVVRKEDQVPIGTCGLLKRDEFDFPDVGFAIKSDFWRRGYASEAAAAALAWGREELLLGKIIAVTSTTNAGSAAVLEKIGLRYEGPIKFDGHMNNRLFS